MKFKKKHVKKIMEIQEIHVTEYFFQQHHVSEDSFLLEATITNLKNTNCIVTFTVKALNKHLVSQHNKTYINYIN